VKHPRRVLVAVTGLSPQVITETLYVLAVRRSPPWIPTEVQLITTSKGAERVRLALLSEGMPMGASWTTSAPPKTTSSPPTSSPISSAA